MNKKLLYILIALIFINSCGIIKNYMKIGKYSTYKDFVDSSDRLINSFENIYENTFVINGEIKKDLSTENIENLNSLEKDIFELNDTIEEVKENPNSMPKFSKVDDKFNDYLKVIQELKTKISEIINYYKNKEYEKDEFNRAKKLYLEYAKLKEDNKNKILEFKKAFGELTSQMIENDIKRMEKSGNIAELKLYEFVNISFDYLSEIEKSYYSDSKLRVDKYNPERFKELKKKI